MMELETAEYININFKLKLKRKTLKNKKIKSLKKN